MAQLRKTLVITLPGLIGAAFVACTAYPGEHPECKGPADNHYLIIYDNGTANKDCVRLSKKGNHQVFWRSLSGRPLTIEFTLASGQQKPFRNMDCLASTCKVTDCHDDFCNSGPVNPLAADYSYYAYHATVGTAKGGDPGVMIDP